MHFLQFSWGATRFVVLVGPVAVKIAKFRVLWIVKRLFHHLKNGEVKTKIRYQAENPTLATSNIFAGVIANRIEYELWKTSPNHFMVPTWYSLGGGLVNFQWCGRAVTEEELNISHPFHEHLPSMTPLLEHDMTKVANFCYYGGRVCLADYGNEEAVAFFSRPRHHKAELSLTAH